LNCFRYCIKAKSKPPAQDNIDMTDFYDDDYDIDEDYDEDDDEDEEAADDTDDSGTGKVSTGTARVFRYFLLTK
jgi:ubiquitin-conjugating enzyme E2 R